ncbi:hypothetical protein T05_2925 [Trichinella murrelli]|uniref:Uncharacterized protein n=1 Tax=Trichinella murrelli TaxID=144512 RepID=A0A0V0TAP4_9BILA|nr:hypothetical protein T05_2925 [Trichinella murrelli]
MELLRFLLLPRHASEQQPMKFYCEKVGGVSGEIGSTPSILKVTIFTCNNISQNLSTPLAEPHLRNATLS